MIFPSICPFDLKTASLLLHQELLLHSKTVAVAESCSGGTLSACLTYHPGASAYFLGGVVTYANSAKSSWLKVPNELIAREGAVSRAVAELMASQVRLALDADYGLSTTGIAGPGGGTDLKPTGMVWASLATREKVESWLMLLCGDRHEVIEKSSLYALNRLFHRLAEQRNSQS